MQSGKESRTNIDSMMRHYTVSDQKTARSFIMTRRSESDHASARPPSVTIQLPKGKFAVKWFQPNTGQWTVGGTHAGGLPSFVAPGWGDWILLLCSND